MAKKTYASLDNYVNGKLVSGGKKATTKTATKSTTPKTTANNTKTTTPTSTKSTSLSYTPPAYSDAYRSGLDTSGYDKQFQMFQEQ